jgi:hypothetical protein
MGCLQPDVMANLLTNVEIEIESGLQKKTRLKPFRAEK